MWSETETETSAKGQAVPSLSGQELVQYKVGQRDMPFGEWEKVSAALFDGTETNKCD